ncbi:GTPase activating protein 1-like [Iris pallida]|uniref:GTPase activating protein 1-like n=1 Tax=Iris pallida TaxID=29817 RepID=A0AAX6DJW0_IRIPA|nr:GTPase activating protein 1-like [Iris pallida]
MVDSLSGLLKVRIQRGVDLAIRDVRMSSDPYVVLRMGKQKLKTKVIKKNVNPVWNEELTLCVEDPTLPVRLEVFDRDRFSADDPMGVAEFTIAPFMEAVKMNTGDLPDGTVIDKVMPCRKNCLAEESAIYCLKGRVMQDVVLRLRNVECGEIELQLEWFSIHGGKAGL